MQQSFAIHPSAIEHRNAAMRLHAAIDSLAAIQAMAKSHYPKSHAVRVRGDKAVGAVRWIQAELANAALAESSDSGLAAAYTTAKRAAAVDPASATAALAGTGDGLAFE